MRLFGYLSQFDIESGYATEVIKDGDMNFFDFSFWQDFVSNALATFLGAIVGIPIALWLSRYQEKIVEKERKNKILRLLRGELLENLSVLSGWEKADYLKKNRDIHSIGPVIKDESWKAFSDGGDLEWIKDPTLLSNLADAYYHVRIIRQISDRFLNIIYLGGDDADKPAIEYFADLLDRGIVNGSKVIYSVLHELG
jgi:hypothetical protein